MNRLSVAHDDRTLFGVEFVGDGVDRLQDLHGVVHAVLDVDLAPLELRLGNRHALQADLHAVDLAIAVDDLAEGGAPEGDVALGPELVVRILDPPDRQA